MINFRKISAILTSTALVGMTMGVAAAANYPAPFVTGGSANAAVVYGTGVGVSPLDAVQASSIKDSLATYVDDDDTSDDTATGGDSVKLERSSDKVNLGDDVSTVYATSVTDDDLEELLAEGTYMDDGNTEFDYTQKVSLGTALDITHFSDSDYDDLIDAADETPTVGIQLAGSVHVLNYTLDFTTHPLFTPLKMETTTLKFMGRDYYVLDLGNGTSTNKTTLLDSATSVLLTEGESQTLTLGDKSYEATIAFIGDNSVKITVNGETTTSLGAGGTYKLTDGTYVGIKEVLYTSKDSGLSKVEFSLGTGKLELSDAVQIELNDDTIEEIYSFFEYDTPTADGYKIDKIILMWSTDDEEFVTPEAEIIMPGFEALKLQMSDHTVAAEEETTVEGGSSYIQIKTTLKNGAVTMPILYADTSGQFSGLGKDSSNKLWTSSVITPTVFFNETANHKYFVASWNSTSEAESYYLKADVVSEDSVDKVRFTNQADGTEKTVTNGSTATFGSVTITIYNITRIGGINETFLMGLNSGGSFNKLYTDEGLKVYLPYEGNSSDTVTGATANLGIINVTPQLNSTAGFNQYQYYLYMEGENKDGNIGGGDLFNLTLNESGALNKVHVAAITTDGTSYEIGSTDDYQYYVTDDLGTKIVHDTGGDYDSATVTYHGEQFYVNLYLSAPEASIGPGTPGTGGVLLVRDSEVASVKSKNLVVVGGSCINTAAATLVGGAYCGSAWTTATEVGMGEFLIKSYSGSTLTDAGKIALLVAGYEYQDTVNAATYLTTKTVDTSAHYVGTSSTEATLVVA